MASSRITGNNEQISTYGDGTRDFTSLSTWEVAKQADLVTAAKSEVLECFDDATSFDDSITFSGSTTDASFFLIVRAAAGEGHDGTPNNGVFFSTTTNVNVFLTLDEFCSVQDVIVKLVLNDDDNRACYRAGSTGGDTKFIGVIAFDSRNDHSNGVMRGCVLNSDKSIIVNCLFTNIIGKGMQFIPGSGKTAYAYNCTSTDNSETGFDNFTGTGIAKNCLSNGNTGEDFDTGGVWTGSSHVASGDDTADNVDATNGRINQTFTFVNAAGDDFHLASTDAGARNFGLALDSDSFFAFDDDIDATTRPGESTWDIGFDEFLPTGTIVTPSPVTAIGAVAGPTVVLGSLLLTAHRGICDWQGNRSCR